MSPPGDRLASPTHTHQSQYTGNTPTHTHTQLCFHTQNHKDNHRRAAIYSSQGSSDKKKIALNISAAVELEEVTRTVKKITFYYSILLG